MLLTKGFRWEIKDENGKVLMNQYKEPPEPLQLEQSPAFGASPYTFIFNPPYAGVFTIKVFLANTQFPEPPSTSELTVTAVNAKPKALPTVIAGPEPIRKSPTGNMSESTGLTIVPAGSKVFLGGFANDKNFFSPELYNHGGTSPDSYGKNHDHYQRQYGWRWKLEYQEMNKDGMPSQLKDITGELFDLKGGSGNKVQYPNFTATKPGKYTATLTVNDNDPYGALESEPSSISVTAVEDASDNPEKCAVCHSEVVTTFSLNRHGNEGTGCTPCHGPVSFHLGAGTEKKKETIGVSYEAGLCGQCHEQYSEWEKSRHSDSESYGYYEIAKPLMVNCYRCHYAKSFAESIEKISEDRISFHELQYKKRLMSIGPMMPDLSKVPGEKDSRITCQACHDSHQEPGKTPFSLRIFEEESICGTCHYEKWQNAVLEGFSGKIKNGYEYPEEDYDVVNPHNTSKKCIFCHMNRGIDTYDIKGVKAVGGHTLRMRDAGPDNILGGFGPSNQDPLIERDSAAKDDILNLAPCLECHPGLDTFNRNDFQKKVYEKWVMLGGLLKVRNNGTLPDVKPGDKCSTCHRGGTLPFDNDPKLILENAYTNYKLVKNDRSWGVHNPKYVIKLLDASIASVREKYPVE